MRENVKIIYDAITVASYFSSKNTSTPDYDLLAGRLGVTKNAILGVKYGYRKIPIRWCPIIEKLTHHKVKCELLRPDIDWSVLINRHVAEKNEEKDDIKLPKSVMAQMNQLDQDLREAKEVK